MIVYGLSISFFVRKLLAYAAERGIEVELRPGGKDQEFAEASPFRKIPAIRDGNYCLSDSSAIIHYLEAKYPDKPLIPAEPEARGRVIWFDEFGDTILSACCTKMFFNRVVSPKLLKRNGDLEVAALAEKEELPPILAYLESVVPEEGFLVGDSLTLADLAVTSPFLNFIHLDVWPASAPYPRLTRYIDRMLARPSFAPFVESEKAFLQKFA